MNTAQQTHEETPIGGQQESHPDNQSTNQPIRQPGWLWVSAGVLAAMIVVQGSGIFESSAMAEMSTTSGSYSIMTTDGGTDEILVVVDSRAESLMVYRTVSSNSFKMLEREELSSLFSRARARAMGRP